VIGEGLYALCTMNSPALPAQGTQGGGGVIDEQFSPDHVASLLLDSEEHVRLHTEACLKGRYRDYPVYFAGDELCISLTAEDEEGQADNLCNHGTAQSARRQGAARQAD
jgi:hypothetical protein